MAARRCGFRFPLTPGKWRGPLGVKLCGGVCSWDLVLKEEFIALHAHRRGSIGPGVFFFPRWAGAPPGHAGFARLPPAIDDCVEATDCTATFRYQFSVDGFIDVSAETWNEVQPDQLSQYQASQKAYMRSLGESREGRYSKTWTHSICIGRHPCRLNTQSICAPEISRPEPRSAPTRRPTSSRYSNLAFPCYSHS